MFGIAGNWIVSVWFTHLMQSNCSFHNSHLVLAAELLFSYTVLILSSSQAEEPLILVHIEFNILVVEFIIVALLYLDLSLFIQLELLFW